MDPAKVHRDSRLAKRSTFGNVARRFVSKLMQPKDWIATFIGILALATSVWTAAATRAHDRLSARPYMQIADEFALSSTHLGLVIANGGPGFGIIDDFRLSLDGTRLEGSWSEQWHQFTKATRTEGWTSQGGLLPGSIVTANSSGIAEILLILDKTKCKPEEWPERLVLLRAAINRLTVNVRYHSAYGEYFEIEQHGIEASTFRRRNWFGHYVDWRP